MKKRTESSVLPAPEIIIPGDRWQVKKGGGSVMGVPDEKGLFQMRVPLTRDSHGKAVLKHEYCHIAFTPKGEILTPTEQAMEDFRVNTLGINNGIDFGEGYDPRVINAKISYEGITGDLKAVILSVIAGRPTNYEQVYKVAEPYLKGVGQTILDQVLYKLTEDYSFENMQDTAKWFDEQFDNLRERAKKQQEEDQGPEIAVTKEMEYGKGEVDGAALELSGKLKIEYPALEKQLKSQAGYKAKVTDSGVMLRRPGRYLVDKKIFENRRRNDGGTILIDVSGSMGLSQEDIVAMVEKRPAATIAIYAGDCNTNVGTIRVIVSKGVMCAPRNVNPDSLGGSNVVDYPALLWLRKQKKPLYWICDGFVTGKGDQLYDTITRECTKVWKGASIKRFHSIKDFLVNKETRKTLGID